MAESHNLKTEFDAKRFALSFQGKEVPVKDVVAVLKAHHGIVVTPHGESGVDRERISDSFKNLDLITALDRLFGAQRYHFDIVGEDRLRPVMGEARNQPEEAPEKRPRLEEMPREQGKTRPDASKNAMAVPERIKASEEIKPEEGTMALAREIKPERDAGLQRPTDPAIPPGRHLRIRLVCTADGFAIQRVKLAEGRLTQRRAVVGDFFVALMDDDKVVHLLSRQNPLLEHPFHHNPDAEGNLPDGPIRIKPGEPCTPFTISLPASDRLQQQTIQFFEYVPKPGSFAPSQLDEENYRKSLKWLEPLGSLPGAAVLRALQANDKPKGEER